MSLGMKAGDEALVVFDHVGFAYADRDGATSVALDDVSFSVAAGECVALVGPNGCGKSTALRLLAGLDEPDAGEVRFDGEAITAARMADQAFAKRLHKRVGLVFQDPDTQLFCPTVRDEVAFGPRQMGMGGDELEGRVADTLALFGIEGLAHRAPYHLSGGEKRKVAMACVVSCAPEVLVCDEPTNALDEDSVAEVTGFLKAFVAAGRTVLLTTHQADVVSALGAREVRMDKSHRVVR
jgi:cobalt/nickel transport system ATP-binding protein